MSRAIAVLGMHRSGTSCLAGLLEDAGVGLGMVSRKNPFNIKGNNENQEIVALHDEILAANARRWDSPGLEACLWSQSHRDRQAGIVAEYSRFGIWGFKDPRSLLALEGWLEYLPDLGLIGSFRHPVAVARSLAARGGIGLGRGLDLWWLYNRRLLAFQARLGFELISFDLPPGAYLDRATAVLSRLGLHPERGTMAFFEAGLRHQEAKESVRLPPEIARMYAELRERA